MIFTIQPNHGSSPYSGKREMKIKYFPIQSNKIKKKGKRFDKNEKHNEQYKYQFYLFYKTRSRNSSEETELNRELDQILSLVINKIFRSQLLLNANIDINQLLIQLIDIVKVAELNSHSDYFNDSLFSMMFNLTKQKIKSNKYIDLCILNDIADCLIDYLGKLNQINTV